MKRLIRDARRALEEDFSRQPDWWQRKAREALVEAEKHATEYATKFLDETEPTLREAIDEASRELTEVRDAMDDLRGSASNGRSDAAAYAQRLHALRERQERAEAVLAETEERIADVERIEDDPVAWYDEQAERMPKALMRGFPW